LKSCNHEKIEGMNPFELIRKYKCLSCNEIMMCSCEEEFAKRYFSHQIKTATNLKTQKRIPVTLGFHL